MKRINKKGFTLVELLGVIVILILILSLVLPKIIGRVKSKESEVSLLNEDILYTSAKLYLDDNVTPSNGNTYCIAVSDLNSDYLGAIIKDYNGDEYSDYYIQASYNDGYSFNLSSSCTPSSPDAERCETEGLCSACYISKTYNNGFYQYDAKIIDDVNDMGLLLETSDYILEYTSNDACMGKAIREAAKEYIGLRRARYNNNSNNTYCIPLTTLVPDYLSFSLSELYNGKTLDSYSVKVTYNGSDFDYQICESCTQNINYICKASTSLEDYKGTLAQTDSNNDPIYRIGDLYECKLFADSNRYDKFHILSFDGENVNLIYSLKDCASKIYSSPSNTACLVSSFITKASFDNYNSEGQTYGEVDCGNNLITGNPRPKAYDGNTYYGPITIMQSLYRITSSDEYTWTNIPNIHVDFIDANRNYYGIQTNTSNNRTYILSKSATSKTDYSHASVNYLNLKARFLTKAEAENVINNYNSDWIRYEGNDTYKDVPIMDSYHLTGEYYVLSGSGITEQDIVTSTCSWTTPTYSGVYFTPVISIPKNQLYVE